MPGADASAAIAAVLERFDPADPGVVVGVFADGQLTGSGAVGVASVEHAVPVSAASLFDIASSSKQVTSTCLLLCEQDGVLSLDDDLRDHLPGLRLREQVTLRQCAQHTGGLREYMAVNGLVGAGGESWRTEEQVIRQLSAYRDTDFPPGTQWSYSNTGYIAIAAVIRRVSGLSLREFAANRVLVPLGMTSSGFQDDAGALVPGRANGHVKAGDAFQRADSLDEVVGDGGLLTNLHDLARWDAFLSDGRVLGGDVRDQLLTRAVLADRRVIPYALGIEHGTVAGRPTVGHGGAIDGFRAHLLHLTGDHLGVAVLANRSDVDVAGVARDVVAGLLGAGPAAASPPERAVPSELSGLWFTPQAETFLVTSADGDRVVMELGAARVPFIASWPGTWRPESLGADVSVRIGEDQLVLSFGDDSWNDTTYERMPDVGVELDAALQGAYLSAELGAFAVIDEADGGLRMAVGAAPGEPLLPVGPDLCRTQSHTVRCTRDDAGAIAGLLISGSRMRRVRFDRSASYGAVGFPVSLGGPIPADPG